MLDGFVGTSSSLGFGAMEWPAFTGLRIITDHQMADRVQFRFPRSKKRRIRKKWAKRQENWKAVPWPRAYQINGTLVMHPAMLAELERVVPRVSNWGAIPIANQASNSVP